MTREEILQAAKSCVCGEREHDYGTPERNFENISVLWGDYLQMAHPQNASAFTCIDGKDVAMMMAMLKIARIATGNTTDSFVDLAGYAACAGEIATGGSHDIGE